MHAYGPRPQQHANKHLPACLRWQPVEGEAVSREQALADKAACETCLARALHADRLEVVKGAAKHSWRIRCACGGLDEVLGDRLDAQRLHERHVGEALVARR